MKIKLMMFLVFTISSLRGMEIVKKDVINPKKSLIEALQYQIQSNDPIVMHYHTLGDNTGPTIMMASDARDAIKEFYKQDLSLEQLGESFDTEKREYKNVSNKDYISLCTGLTDSDDGRMLIQKYHIASKKWLPGQTINCNKVEKFKTNEYLHNSKMVVFNIPASDDESAKISCTLIGLLQEQGTPVLVNIKNEQGALLNVQKLMFDVVRNTNPMSFGKTTKHDDNDADEMDLKKQDEQKEEEQKDQKEEENKEKSEDKDDKLEETKEDKKEEREEKDANELDKIMRENDGIEKQEKIEENKEVDKKEIEENKNNNTNDDSKNISRKPSSIKLELKKTQDGNKKEGGLSALSQLIRNPWFISSATVAALAAFVYYYYNNVYLIAH